VGPDDVTHRPFRVRTERRRCPPDEGATGPWRPASSLRRRRCDVIFAALAMLVLAAIALPMATIALSRSARKTIAADGEQASSPAATDQRGNDPAAAR
jgi:hypothetical protein